MKLESRQRIEAPPDVVWDVTVDVERWPEWTPTVNAVTRLDDGPFQVGSVAVLEQPGLPAAEWRVTALEKGRMFTWESRVRGMDIVATHEMQVDGSGTTSILRVELTGLLVTLFAPVVRRSVGRALESENTGLKVRSEAASTA